MQTFQSPTVEPRTAATPTPAIAQTRTLQLRGVDHTARPTWKLRETIEFYRDKLGLPLVHVISARGWGPASHPDFLHFFFDSGNGSAIAFFYYLGSEPPAALKDRPEMAPVPEDHVFDATHTAWLVEGVHELQAWKNRLESMGLKVSTETAHEVIESIYVRDPNGYFVEFTRKLRPLADIDASDGALTLQAALEAEDEARAAGGRVDRIDTVWARKARLLEVLEASHGGVPSDSVQDRSVDEEGRGPSRSPVCIFVPRLAEFASLVHDASARDDCRVSARGSYDVIESDGPLEFRRKVLGLKPAVWYGLFTGGVRGRIEVFDRDRVSIVPEA